jgi:hypothetical protein
VAAANSRHWRRANGANGANILPLPLPLLFSRNFIDISSEVKLSYGIKTIDNMIA